MKAFGCYSSDVSSRLALTLDFTCAGLSRCWSIGCLITAMPLPFSRDVSSSRLFTAPSYSTSSGLRD